METITYKEHIIRFKESSGKFRLLVEGSLFYENESLNKVKTQIDKLVKKSFKRFSAYIKTWSRWDKDEDDNFTKIEVTSIAPDGSIWIIDKEKNRQKLYKSDRLYKINKKNLGIIGQIKEVAKREKKLDSEKELLFKQLEHIEIKKVEEE